VRSSSSTRGTRRESCTRGRSLSSCARKRPVAMPASPTRTASGITRQRIELHFAESLEPRSILEQGPARPKPVTSVRGARLPSEQRSPGVLSLVSIPPSRLALSESFALLQRRREDADAERLAQTNESPALGNCFFTLSDDTTPKRDKAVDRARARRSNARGDRDARLRATPPGRLRECGGSPTPAASRAACDDGEREDRPRRPIA